MSKRPRNRKLALSPPSKPQKEALDTSHEINVEVNGQQITLPHNSTLADALSVSKAPYKEGTAIGMLKETTGRKTEEITEYTITTSRGEFKIELLEPDSDSKNRWFHHFKKYEGTPIRWISRDAVAFGPFGTDIHPTRGTSNFERFEVAYGAGGFDPENTHLILSKNRHVSEYGMPQEGTFARIISGKNVLHQLNKIDTIISIEPIIEWEKMAERLCTTDLSTKIDDGVRIFTYFEVELEPLAPEGAEHFLALTRNGTFKVDLVASSFISDNSLQGEMCKYENFDPRIAGSVAVRTVGDGSGKAYIACDDRNASIMHSVVGHVTKGLELVKLAESGQRLVLKTIPDQIMVLGMGFEEADEHLSRLGVELVRDGYTGEDAVIVKNTPGTTIDILREGKVTAFGVQESRLIKIKLYDDLVPKTLNFFRHAIELQFRPVGALPVLMKYENTYLFKAEKAAEKYKEIMPENTPTDKVLAGEIGVTNQAAKRMGVVGVKTKDDSLFGPSGEKFTNTNIIGRILELDKLKDLKDGDVMYVVESRGDDD
ncbi:MAG: methanogenesis marker 3 protein [Methanosarcinaceae archaeon]|nr:methanogenesis marker 3 protein [Methanosarcinaceae archaeon]